VIKVGGSASFPDRGRTVFEAAAIAQSVSGAPILTHCEDGLRGPEQVRFLDEHGADPRHVVLSHVDKVVDRGYHRELADTDAFVEFDQGVPLGRGENGTLRILEWLAEDGRIGHVVMGHDHARRGHWKAYGGGPGMDYLLRCVLPADG
jgi:5-phospho-D-xylono-1,4-lactonase